MIQQRVFADAGYWIGLFNPRDHLHEKAAAAFRGVRAHQIVTSEMVLTEMLNHFSERDPYLAFGSKRRRIASCFARDCHCASN